MLIDHLIDANSIHFKDDDLKDLQSNFSWENILSSFPTLTAPLALEAIIEVT